MKKDKKKEIDWSWKSVPELPLCVSDLNWKIREAVKASKYTQEEVATAINVSRPYFNQIVTKNTQRQTRPSPYFLKRLADFLEIDLKFFQDEKYTVDDVFKEVFFLTQDDVCLEELENSEELPTKKAGIYRDINTDMKQVGGNHYEKKNIQPWDVTLDWKLDPWLASVVRYISRHQDKNGIEDIRKAIHYLKYVEENYSTIKEKYYGVEEK